MKKLLIKLILRLICVKDVLFSESFELKATYKKNVISVKFSDVEIDKHLQSDESIREDIKDSRKKTKPKRAKVVKKPILPQEKVITDQEKC